MIDIDFFKDMDQNGFYTLYDLTLEGHISFQEAASAIELAGIQAFDAFGRFVILKPNEPHSNDGVSINGALRSLAQFVSEEQTRTYNNESDPRENNEFWRRDAELSHVIVYGWRIKDFPEFSALHNQWCKDYAGIDASQTPEKPISPQSKSSVKRLIRGLVEIHYGDLVKTLDQQRSPLISKLEVDLRNARYPIDKKTLRIWLKNNTP